MRLLSSATDLSLYALITTIIQSCVGAQSDHLPWPYNLPPGAKYYPEDETLIKSNMDTLQKLQVQSPNAIRKMSSDPNEKFFFDYWSFGGGIEDDRAVMVNASIVHNFDTPLSLHANDSKPDPSILMRFLRTPFERRGIFAKRDFGCPAGTQSCASVNRPGVCCPSSTTCQIVPDTGLGDVGCCEASEICAGSLSTCPSGYSSCPNNPGGGCCLPGYACYGAGCVLTSTTVVVIVPSPSSISSTVLLSTVTATSVVVVTPTSSSTDLSATVSSTSVTTTVVPTTSTVSPSLTCSSGFRSCPASLGGGCCATDRACGSNTCPAVSSSGTAGAPIRPTTVTTTADSTTSSSIVGCPTGFYACSAYYQGGCCQVGRDCAKTSCPAVGSTIVVSTNGVTAAAPTGTYLSGHTTLLTGMCASGWLTCASTLGGGCCPSGYACGTASCSATASGGGGNLVGKTAPNKAHSARDVYIFWTLLACSMASFAVMIAL